jgi:integrase
VPFPRFLADDLAARMVGKRREDLVFSAPGGGVLRIATFRTRVFNPAVSNLRAPDDDGKPTTDWPRPTLHDLRLRHTAASLAISAGANVKAVQTMLGQERGAHAGHLRRPVPRRPGSCCGRALDAAVRTLRGIYCGRAADGRGIDALTQ